MPNTARILDRTDTWVDEPARNRLSLAVEGHVTELLKDLYKIGITGEVTLQFRGEAINGAPLQHDFRARKEVTS